MAIAECVGCGHVSPLHNANGCRINGCPCRGLTAEMSPEPVSRSDTEMDALRAQVAELRITSYFLGVMIVALIAIVVLGWWVL